MSIIKPVAVLALLSVLLLTLVLFFSAHESRFECHGTLYEDEVKDTRATVFLKVQDYRWWVALWSDSRGSVWLEVPLANFEYFENVNRAGDLIQFRDSSGKKGGIFSYLSLAVKVHLGKAEFDGACKRVVR